MEEAVVDHAAPRVPPSERERLEGSVAKPRAEWGMLQAATMQAAAS